MSKTWTVFFKNWDSSLGQYTAGSFHVRAGDYDSAIIEAEETLERMDHLRGTKNEHFDVTPNTESSHV